LEVWVPLLPSRFRKGKRRVEPRFGVECQPRYVQQGGQWRLSQITLTIRNEADIPHRVDEALIRYDDGRVGYTLPLDVQLKDNIPAHSSVSFQVRVSDLLDPGAAARFWIVIYRGRHGQRLEWSSKAEPFVGTGPRPAAG
jgi:hypothetical protein